MFLRPQEIDTDYQLGACMGLRNGAMRDGACGGRRKEYMNHAETDKGDSRLIFRARRERE